MTVASDANPVALVGILCPSCGRNSSRVVESREAKNSVRRRRECVRCGGRWTTIEREASFQRFRGEV